MYKNKIADRPFVLGLRRRRPAGQAFGKLHEALLHAADVAFHQEHLDGKNHLGNIRRETQSRDRIVHHANKIRARQDDGRDTALFEFCGSTAAIC